MGVAELSKTAIDRPNVTTKENHPPVTSLQGKNKMKIRLLLLSFLLLLTACGPDPKTCNNYQVITGYFEMPMGWSQITSYKVCVVSVAPYSPN